MNSNLISRQAAIEAIEAIPEGNWRKQRYIDVLVDLPDMRWTPVKERLPEEDVDVLITYRYREGEGDTSNTYIDITSYGQLYIGGSPRGHKKYWRQPFAYFASNYEVIAWMPLPTPYEDE